MGDRDITSKHRRTFDTSDVERMPTPGKRTAVESAPAAPRPKTNEELADAIERNTLDDTYTKYVTAMILNLVMAASNVISKLGQKKTKPGWWGWVAELIFRGVSDWLIGAGMRSFTAWREAPTMNGIYLDPKSAEWVQKHVKEAHAKSALVAGSSSLRTGLKEGGHHVEDHSADQQWVTSFVQESVAPMLIDLTVKQPKGWSKEQLAGMTAMFAAGLETDFTVAAFEAAIYEKLDRFHAERLDTIGEARTVGMRSHRELVNVVRADSSSRPALVEYFETNTAIDHKQYDGKYVPTTQPEFVGWVSDDLYSSAFKAHTEANHTTTARTVDASQPTGMKEIDAWGAITIEPIKESS